MLQATNPEMLRPANNGIVPVLDLGDLKLWRRRNQPTDQGLSLHPRQVHADALMHAITEAEMGLPLAVDIEALGIAENCGIVVGHTRQEVDRITASEWLAGQLHAVGPDEAHRKSRDRF